MTFIFVICYLCFVICICVVGNVGIEPTAYSACPVRFGRSVDGVGIGPTAYSV